jgi:CheY-like chemotaxis protein
MNIAPKYLLLADDDKDDCDLFTDALNELDEFTILKTVHDGEQLMHFLTNETCELPDILFLDLNMPRKNGYECLTEIKVNDKLKSLPVIVFSTSFDREMVQELYKNGAQYYISKPNEFTKLKKVIHNAISSVSGTLSKTSLENFVIQP